MMPRKSYLLSTSEQSSISTESTWEGAESSQSFSVSNTHDVHYLENVKFLGVHKRERPKVSYLFVIIVKWSDRSQVTIYRRWSDIRKLQADLLRVTPKSENRITRKYLKLMGSEVETAARFLRGTIQKLKMIDSLNQYFKAVLHFTDLAHFGFSHDFFRPNDMDLCSTEWSGDGRTYFYLARDILGERNQVFDDEYNKIMNAEEEQYNELYSHEIDGFLKAIDGGLHRSDSNISWPIQSNVHVAVYDYIASDEDEEQNIISLRVGDEVTVLDRNVSGWWLVSQVDAEERIDDDSKCGYAPATFLRKRDDIVLGAFAELTDQASQEKQRLESRSSSYEVGETTYEPSDEPLHAYSTTFSDYSSGNLDMYSDEVAVKNVLKKRNLENDWNKSSASSSLASSPFDSSASLPVRHTQPQIRSFRKRASSMVALKPHAHPSETANRFQNTRAKRRPTLDSSSTYFLNNSLSGSVPSITRSSSIISSSMSAQFLPLKKGVDHISTKKYAATNSDEISFDENAIIKVLQKNTNGWWIASYKDKIGVVPGVHLKKYNDPLRRFSVSVFDLL